MERITLQHWLTLLGMFILMIIINMDYSAVNVALVDISDDFQTDLNNLQWLLSGYILTWCAFVVAAGKLADIYGQYKLLIIGTTIFLIASLICGAAPNIETLITGRALQGLGGALFVPPVYAITFQTFPPNKQAFAIGVLGTAAGLGLAVGPSFGGWMIDLFDWRWIFYAMIPLVVASMVASMLFVAKDKPQEGKKERIDMTSFGLMAAALGLIMFAVNQVEVWVFSDARLLIALSAGIAACLLYIWRSKSISNPLIPAIIFESRTYTLNLLIFFADCMVFALVLVSVSLYLQNVRGMTAFEAGNTFLPMMITFGILSPLGGKICDKVGAERLMPIALGLAALGTGMGALITTTSDLTYIMSMLFIIGLGLGLLFPATNALMLQNSHPKSMNTCSGVFIMGATFGNATGVVICTSMIVGFTQSFISKNISSLNLDTAAAKNLMTLAGSAHRDTKLLESLSNKENLITFLNDGFVSGFNGAMALACGLMITSLIISLRMERKAS